MEPCHTEQQPSFAGTIPPAPPPSGVAPTVRVTNNAIHPPLCTVLCPHDDKNKQTKRASHARQKLEQRPTVCNSVIAAQSCTTRQKNTRHLSYDRLFASRVPRNRRNRRNRRQRCWPVSPPKMVADQSLPKRQDLFGFTYSYIPLCRK